MSNATTKIRWSKKNEVTGAITLGNVLAYIFEPISRKTTMWVAYVPTLGGLGAPARVSGTSRSIRAAKLDVIEAFERRGVRFTPEDRRAIGGGA